MLSDVHGRVASAALQSVSAVTGKDDQGDNMPLHLRKTLASARNGGVSVSEERSALVRRATPMRAPQRPQRPSGLATRRRLLDAGREIFAAHGVSGAATQDITAAAAVAPTALYHHFGSKAGLFLAVAQEVYAIFIGGLTEAVDGAEDFDDAIRRLVAAASQLHESDPTIAQMAITVQFEVQHSATLRAELAEPLADFQHLASRVAALAPNSRLGPGGTRAMALAVTGLMNGLCSLAATLRHPEDFAAASAAFSLLLSP